MDDPSLLEVKLAAAIAGVDARTVLRELHDPGSVRGNAGCRARAAVAQLRAGAYRRNHGPEAA